MNRTWYNPLLMFVWLTVGFAVIHIAICSWLIGIWMAAWPNSIPYENLHFNEDGEPIIQVWTQGIGEVTFRRFDGTRVPNTQLMRKKLLSPTHISYRSGRAPATWGDRIVSYRDFQTPTTYWYHVEPPGRIGTSYFEGFDKATRRPIGFIGLNGFSASRPSVEQSFPIRSSSLAARSGLLTALQQDYRAAVEPYNEYAVETENASIDTVWLLSVDSIYEIQLNSRSVRSLLQNNPQSQYLTHSISVREGKPYLKLLVRCDAGMLILDPQSKETETVTLSPMQPSTSYYEQFYEETSGRRIHVRSSYEMAPPGTPRMFDITWFDIHGDVVRHVETTLQYPGNRLPTNALPICLPIPIACYGTWFIAPDMLIEHSQQSTTYLGQLGAFAAQMWRWLSVSLLAGIAAGWGCWRREREVFHRTGFFWPILVGLCGWFGWVGYMFLRPLPARLPDGQWIPASPEPNGVLGTEIFA